MNRYLITLPLGLFDVVVLAFLMFGFKKKIRGFLVNVISWAYAVINCYLIMRDSWLGIVQYLREGQNKNDSILIAEGVALLALSFFCAFLWAFARAFCNLGMNIAMYRKYASNESFLDFCSRKARICEQKRREKEALELINEDCEDSTETVEELFETLK